MLAIIGGTGLYSLDALEGCREEYLQTPFGAPSGPLVRGRLAGREVLFLARHGAGHRLLPHEVNYRANIHALKQAGATRVLGVSAVGSLRGELTPGLLVLPDQYFDFVKGSREKTFFGQGLAAHVSTAEPVCSALALRVEAVAEATARPLHRGGTYACVDGPRLGTRAESFFLRDAARCDLVGMTNVPEVFLAREAQLCYASLAIVTDYDCWQDDPAEHVSVEQVIARYGASLAEARALVADVIAREPEEDPDCSCRQALASAVLTPEEARDERARALLRILSA